MRILLILLLLAVFVPVANAQNTELFVGPTFVRASPNFSRPDFSFNKSTDQVGFDAAITGFFGDRSIGLTADIGASWSGRDADDASLVTVMGGPTLKARSHRVQPFARGLIGIGRFAARSQQLSFNFNKETTGLAWAAGGGIDIEVSEHFLVRPVQADYLGTRILDTNVRYLRASAGVVFRW